MARKMRKFHVAPQSAPNSDINITPLVDVVLVLLIIFMVVTPLLEKDIEVRVPDSEQVEDPSEVPPDQLVVSLDEGGEISINQEKVAADEYVEKLKRVLAARARGDRLVFFTAADKTNYARLVSALDGARLAGAEILGMATEKLEPATAPESAPGATPTPWHQPP
jgi:biopolymer transport protein ExbD/biopolymer transport protein TolR